jgi:hypothetical protein
MYVYTHACAAAELESQRTADSAVAAGRTELLLWLLCYCRTQETPRAPETDRRTRGGIRRDTKGTGGHRDTTRTGGHSEGIGRDTKRTGGNKRGDRSKPQSQGSNTGIISVRLIRPCDSRLLVVRLDWRWQVYQWLSFKFPPTVGCFIHIIFL